MADDLSPEYFSGLAAQTDDMTGADIQRTVVSAMDTNPDAAARASALAKKTNLPAQAVEQDLEFYEKDQKYGADYFSALNKKHPDLAAFLADPENAKLVHDDVSALTSVFDIFARSPASGGLQGVGMGIQGLGSLSTDVSRYIGQQTEQRNPIYSMNKDMQMIRLFTGLFGNVAQPGGKLVRDAGKAIDVPEERRNTATDVGSGLGQVAGQILVYVMNPYAGTAMMVGQGSQQQADRLDAAGVTDPGQRVLAQGLGGIATYATERVELGVLLKGVPGLDKAIGRLPTALQNKWLARSIDVTAAGGAEAAQETIEGFLQDLIEYQVYNPDVEFLADMRRQAEVAGMTGAIARALVMGISGARKGQGEMQRQKDAEETAAQTLADKQTVQQSKLLERDPERMRELMENANVSEQTARFDATVVQEFYQSGIDPEELFNAIPEAREQFEQAEMTGADVVLPMDKVLTAMAADKANTFDFMADFMKADPDGPYAGQKLDPTSEEFNDRVRDILEDARREMEAEQGDMDTLELDQRIERKITETLMNRQIMGEKARAPEAARSEAALYSAFVRTMLQRGNAATRKVLENAFGSLEFKGPNPPPRLPVTGQDFYIDRLRTQKRRKASQEKQADKRAAKAGLFGAVGKRRTASTPTPLINALIARGGIERGSIIASELSSIGITPKSHPRLYKKGGKARGRNYTPPLSDIDNIPVDELEAELRTSGIFSRDAEFNGYVDRQELLDMLRDESFGNYIRTDEQLVKEQQDEYDAQVIDAIQEQGLDIETATNDEIKAALEKAQAEYTKAAESGEYYQDFDGKRGSIQFDRENGRTLISLFENADQTTLLHETGHFFLDVFSQIASDPDAPQEIRDMWQNTLDWMGVKSYDQVGRDQHEQFARGFEAYLFEGKAPSQTLIPIFDKFLVWFANLYRSVKSLNVKLNPEIRDVFDRMLATNDEIDAQRRDPLLSPSPDALAILSGPERAAYERQREKAFAEAKAKLFRKAIRQKRRENTEWWKEESARLQKLVEKELQSDPAQRAIQFLQTGNDFDGQPIAGGAKGLDEASVVSAFADPREGREALKYLPRNTRTKDGGVDAKIVADMFGFKNASAMLDAIINADPYKLAVQKGVETEMMGRYGDMLNDGTIEREALEMVMAESADMAMVELKAVSEKIGKEVPQDGDFKRAAEITIGRSSVDNAIAPDKFYRAALKAAKAYGKAVGKGDFAEAAKQKGREILNKHLYRMARDAREEVDKGLQRFQKLNKQPAKGKQPPIDPAYHQKIWDILDKYNLGPRLSEARRLKLELAAINAWIQEQETNDGAALQMPPEILAADNKQHYRDLTLNEFRGLRDLVVNIETQGRNKQEFRLEGQKRALKELTNELAIIAEQHNKPLDVAVSQRRADQKIKRAFGKVVNAIDGINTKTQQLMVQMDGGDNFGLWTRTIYEPVQRAEVAKNIRSRKEFEIFKALMKKHYDAEASGFLDREIPAGAEPIRFEEMLSIALHQGTEDNRQKLIDGYQKARGWDQDFIDRILQNMRKKDWDFVQDMWDYLDSFWAETSAVEQRRFGYAPEKIEALPFETVTADGQRIELRGGYMRIMYDSDQDVTADNQELAASFNDMRVGKGARAATKRGSQIERVSGVKRPIRLDLDVLTEHIGEQVGIITMSETVENVAKVLKAQNIQETLHSILGREKKAMLDLWLQDVAVGGALAGGTINRSLRTIRANYTVGRLGLRPVTALLQFSGLSHTVADMGIPQASKGLARLFSRGNPYAVINDIRAKSVYMQERKFTLNRDIADALRAYTAKGDSVRSKVSALMLYPMQKTQELVDAITWLAAYDKAIKDLDEADAVRSADIAVSRLQASGLTSDLAAIERGTINAQTQRQEWVKASTMFFSYFNAKYNIVKNKTIQFQNKEISAVDLAGSYLMAIVVEGLISAAIMGQIDWDDDDDGELSAGEIAMGVAGVGMSQGAATVPFVRTIWGGAEGFSGETAAEGQLAGLGEFAGRLVKSGKKLAEGEEINHYALTRNAVDALNTFAPLPASTINQFIRGMEKEAEDGDATLMDYLVYRPE